MHKTLPIAVLVLSVILLSLAAPRLLASFINFSASAVLVDLPNASDEQLSLALNAIERSIAIAANSVYWQQYSELFFYKAKQQGLFNANALQYLMQAKKANEQALAYSPSKAQLWYQLAVIHLLLGNTDKKAAQFLRLSLFTGAYELQYFMPRLQLCLLLIDDFEQEDFELLSHQIKVAWQLEPQFMLANILINEQSWAAVTRLLAVNNAPLLTHIQQQRANR